jgi:hypothetical protein
MKTKVNILVNGKRCVGCIQSDGSIKVANGKIYKPEEVAEIKYFEEKKP